MSPILTEKEFSKHVHTKFRIALEPPVELELAEVKSYLPKENEARGMERFSLYFAGPREPHLIQHVYPMEHELMGAFDIFLVPVAQDENGFRYEAVFNYYKEKAVE